MVAANKRCARALSTEAGSQGPITTTRLKEAPYEGETAGSVDPRATQEMGGYGRRYGNAEIRTKRALIVDDHDLFRQMLALLLGWYTDLKENIQAESRKEARKALGESEGNIDLAIVDLDLPRGEALELAKDLRAISPGAPLLGITANSHTEQTASELENVADQVLTTAASSQEIIAAVRQLRNQPRDLW